MPTERIGIVIPARLHSTRLPRKMLLNETGRTLIEHTYQAASRSSLASAVLVATDHAEIADAVRAFGGEVLMTRPDHASGSERIAEVATARDDLDVFVNVQGDEPEMDAGAIDAAVEALLSSAETSVSTAATPIRDPALVADPNVVKVVCDAGGHALYFSRSPIPYVRDDPPGDVAPLHLQHLGLYAYRREFLLRLPSLPASALEQAEKLEQLRILAAGERIRVATVDHATPGIDTAADYAAFVARQASR